VEFSHQPVPSQSNNKLKQQGDGAGEHLNCDKLRVAWHGPGNTRVRRTNTANRAPNMPMHRRHVPVHVCTISILWNFIPVKQQGDHVCSLPLPLLLLLLLHPAHHTNTQLQNEHK
jgi:hypothetical protein